MKKNSLIFFTLVWLNFLMPCLLPASSFVGTGAGDIPDSPYSDFPAHYGTPLVVSFTVTNMQTNVQSVALSITMKHQWVGDLDVKLTSPSGSGFAGTNFTIFSRVGPSAPFGYGNPLDLDGTYLFTDAATNTLSYYPWWLGLDYGNGTDYTNVIPSGRYQPSAIGTGSTTSYEPAVTFGTNSGLVGLPPARVNGVWTLSFRDGSAGDTGSVQAATLFINQPPLRFTSIVVSNGAVVLNLTGPSDQSFSLWCGTNLLQSAATWQPAGGGTFDFYGNAALTTNLPAAPGFFRASVP